MKFRFQRRNTTRQAATYDYEATADFRDPESDEWERGWSGDGSTVVDIKRFLNGDYTMRITLQAEKGELESWLKRYAEKHPKEAVTLLCRAFQIAADKLSAE